MTSLKKLAIKGAIWTLVSYGLSNVLRLVSNLILTRLLVPELFGLMTLVTTFVMGLSLFSDVGIGTSIVQNKRGDDPKFLNTAWTMQVVRGVILWIFCLILAWPTALLYKEPQLTWLLPLVGFTTIFSGFNSTSQFTLGRQISLGKLAAFELGTQIIGLIGTIGWALFIERSIWALVCGTMVSSLVRLVWSHFLVPGQRNGFAWDRDAAQSIFALGKWIYLSTAFTFLSEQADKYMLPKLIGFAAFGVYGIAFQFADIPRQVLMALSGRVLFPVFSQLADLPREEFRLKIQQSRQIFLLASTVFVVVLACLGDQLIHFLYSYKYYDAMWMIPLLAIGFWPRILTQTIDQSLFALGRPRFSAYAYCAKFIYMLAALPLGFRLWGTPGAILVVALNDIPYYVTMMIGLWQEKLTCLKQDLQMTLLFVGLLTLGLGLRYFAGFGTPIDTMPALQLMG